VLGDENMAITKSQLTKTSWELLYDLINTNVTDPKVRGIQWVFSAFPDTRKWPENVDMFPVIVIENSDVTNDRIVWADSTRNFTFRQIISVFATRADQLDTITDSVLNTFNSNYNYLLTNNAAMLKITSSPTSFTLVGKERVHERKIAIEFQYVM
jgi:hypothetical protein